MIHEMLASPGALCAARNNNDPIAMRLGCREIVLDTALNSAQHALQHASVSIL
jgi:hypothetical protein